MIKSKTLSTLSGQRVNILHENDGASLLDIMKMNRHIEDEQFFSPSLDHLHDPYLMPDMEKAVHRILEARERKERVIIFGDYDVDGVSSTAILFRYFSEIGIECSYRLPHRVEDGYGLKDYFFTELAEKKVKLVVTVDCGTRDIGPIQYAKSLGIDVIVTDHHAVPEVIPDEVIAIVNPKRKDSLYPFPSLAGAGVAFKLLHAIALALTESTKVQNVLTRYIDLASLGTVSDCMPLIGENRIITALGLKQMKKSESSALRKFLEKNETESEGNADVIGFQIGPRINAAGRMDSPLKALHWLLATEDRVDSWLEEVESLNMKRQEVVKTFTEDALMNVDTTNPILFYTHPDLEHGLIGLVAGRLTEAYGKPSIVLCTHHDSGKESKKREYEKDLQEISEAPKNLLVASCRAPEWCHLVELLDTCKDYFLRYGGHRQAAGFTIESSQYVDFQKEIVSKFEAHYDITHLPGRTISVESVLSPSDVSLETLSHIDLFRPFGIGNQKPLFLLENMTIQEIKTIGKEKNHLSLIFAEMSDIKCLLWNFESLFGDAPLPSVGDILSPILFLERNIWNGRENIQIMIKDIIL